MTKHPREKYEAKYPALSDLLVTILSNQHQSDWLGSATAEYVANSDPGDLPAVLAELSAATKDSDVLPDEISRLTNYDLGSRQEMLDFLEELGKKLSRGRGA